MITFWRGPGKYTMTREANNGVQHISKDRAEFEIKLFKKNGYTVTDHGHKITIKK